MNSILYKDLSYDPSYDPYFDYSEFCYIYESIFKLVFSVDKGMTNEMYTELVKAIIECSSDIYIQGKHLQCLEESD